MQQKRKQMIRHIYKRSESEGKYCTICVMNCNKEKKHMVVDALVNFMQRSNENALSFRKKISQITLEKQKRKLMRKNRKNQDLKNRNTYFNK